MKKSQRYTIILWQHLLGVSNMLYSKSNEKLKVKLAQSEHQKQIEIDRKELSKKAINSLKVNNRKSYENHNNKEWEQVLCCLLLVALFCSILKIFWNDFWFFFSFEMLERNADGWSLITSFLNLGDVDAGWIWNVICCANILRRCLNPKVSVTDSEMMNQDTRRRKEKTSKSFISR